MTVRFRCFLFLALMLAAACSETNQLPTYDLSGDAMGTTFNVTLVAPPVDTDLDALQARIYEVLEHVEDIASTYRSESELSRFNADPSTDWIKVTPEFCHMVVAALDVSFLTKGAFDITVGPLVNLWGFGPTDMTNELPTNGEIVAAQAMVGYEKLETDCDYGSLRKTSAGMYVDLSGWAKGYAVDEIADLLDAEHFENYLVEIGGELQLKGHNPAREKFNIAVEKPLKNNNMQYAPVRVTNASVASSGDYRNYYEHDGQRYSHTIDPRTGRPISHSLTGVTVVSTTTAYADAMATALLVLGADDGHALAEKLKIAAYFLVKSDNGIEEKLTSEFEKLRQQ